MSWTDERVALLKKLWGEGKTAAEIAKELGGVTRNAVIGKAHRLKISNRVSPIQQNKKTTKVAVKKAKVEKTVPVAANSQPVKPKVTKAQNVKMIELTARMCRWPQGDPKDPDFSFCGDTAFTGLPYCEEHAKQAYQSASRNRLLKAGKGAGAQEERQRKSA